GGASGWCGGSVSWSLSFAVKRSQTWSLHNESAMAGCLRSQFRVRVRQQMWRSGHTFAYVTALDLREEDSTPVKCARPSRSAGRRQTITHRHSHNPGLHQEGVRVPGRDGSATVGAATAGVL